MDRRPLALACLTTLALAGCGGDRRPSTAILGADDFRLPDGASDARPTTGADRAGVVIYDPNRPPQAVPYDGPPDPARRSGNAPVGTGEPVRAIDPVVARPSRPTPSAARPAGRRRRPGRRPPTAAGST